MFCLSLVCPVASLITLTSKDRQGALGKANLPISSIQSCRSLAVGVRFHMFCHLCLACLLKALFMVLREQTPEFAGSAVASAAAALAAWSSSFPVRLTWPAIQLKVIWMPQTIKSLIRCRILSMSPWCNLCNSAEHMLEMADWQSDRIKILLLSYRFLVSERN